ncbi:iron sulfur assembly protein 1 [Pochonia chlamydosporia 170]|uniref:Iron-sulfur assembly protein 1 n=1 Tax=Pochonia chlamydosporia 170 TaxID=1380566 RepID=A0A179G720_METCM|nr:iron sulfur assembly protein 1 [Pochonia chlamydosporia 170]OAQ73338.1 iron sulfur assembly protein 1 [Pochonia chlamydosporia 170]
MNAHILVARVALRQSCSNSLRQIPASRLFASAYHSYSLPTSTTRNVGRESIPESSVAHPEKLPKVHETRPPPKQATQAATPATPEPIQDQASTSTSTSTSKAAEPAVQKPKAARPRPKLRARKAAMKLTPAAVEQLRAMLDQPDPKLIKVGVRNRGCSGLAYHLEYVDKPGTFDELVEQDGVKVLIDSKALFSIIGTEMDWAEDKLNQRFVFKNPNIKEQCGCGESFMV